MFSDYDYYGSDYYSAGYLNRSGSSRSTRTFSSSYSRDNVHTQREANPEKWKWPDSFDEKFIFFYLRRHSAQYPEREFKINFHHNVDMMSPSLKQWYDAAVEATKEALEHNRFLKSNKGSSSEKLLCLDVRGKNNLRSTEVKDQYKFRFSINPDDAQAISIFGNKLIAVLMHRVSSNGGSPVHGLASIYQDRSNKCILEVMVSLPSTEKRSIESVEHWSIKFLNAMAKNVLISSDNFQDTKVSGEKEEALHESSEYIFRKKILNWDLEALDNAPEVPNNITRIGQRYESVANYCKAFQLRLYDEVKASIKQGLEKKNKFSFELEVGRNASPEFSRDIDDPNPSKFIVNCQIPEEIIEEYTEHEVVVQLNPKGAKSLKLTGILNRNRGEDGSSKSNGYNIKFIFNNQQRMMFANAFRPGKLWEVFALTSLSSYMRLYALTESKVESNTQMAIIRSEIPSWPELSHKRYNTDELRSELETRLEQQSKNNLSYYAWRFLQAEKVLAALSLNQIQEDYILRYLKAEDGLYPLQGPPGTGKTTTICALLEILYGLNRRVLVCAPSNKAVQVIAKRFYEQHENLPVTYIGVEGKIDEKLMPIFYDRWAEQQLKIVTEAVRLVNDEKLYPKKLITRQSAQNLKKKFRDLIDQLYALNSQLNYARSFVTISFPMLLIHTLEKWLENSLSVFIDTINHIINARNEIFSAQNLDDSKEQKIPSHATLPKLPGIEEFDSFKQTAGESIQAASERLLSNAKIVFCTLVTSARQSIREYYNEHYNEQPFFDDLIIDEAGQSVELESMLPIGFYRVRKTLLVGDTNQLPATVISEKNKDTYRLPDGQMRQGANYRRSMMKRLEENGVSVPTLEIQYRMEEAIQRFPSQQCYNERLRPAEHILEGRNNLRPFDRNQVPEYLFLHVDGKQSQASTSLQNHKEANVIVRIAKYLANISTINPSDHIGVITFYSAQVVLLRQLLNQDSATRNIKVSTVDGFQGDENAIILLSLVRSSQESLGFVEEYERLNVALTRAMFALYIVGNKKAFMASGEALNSQLPMAYRLVPDAQERGAILNADSYLKSVEPNTENSHDLIKKKSSPSSHLVNQQTVKQIVITSQTQPAVGRLFSSSGSSNKKVNLKKSRPSGVSSNEERQHEEKTKKSKENQVLTGGRVCSFFNGKSDSCNKGDSCKFKHMVPSDNA